jgi:lincosamide nucleotidyltransferase
MQLQETMIERVRALCQRDNRVSAAMMYGSFTRGEGDEFSDIEFLVFFEDESFDTLDRRAWLEQIAPVALMYVNDFGITAVIFENLVRGEFHFHKVAEVTIAEAWRGVLTFPSLESTLLVDKSGALTPYLLPIIGPDPQRDQPDKIQFLADNFTNQYLFGVNVLRRGELARALEMLGVLHRITLGMARILAGKTGPWFIPSKMLERDLTPDEYARFRACTAILESDSLRRAYQQIGLWAGEMLDDLRARYGIETHDNLRAQIAALVEKG